MEIEHNMKKIQSLQGFRALGFICVFLWHCGKGNAGTYAVSLFVMLSGFLLMFRDSGGGWKKEDKRLHAVLKVQCTKFGNCIRCIL